ncbi:MAG: hypothetical protein HYW38_01955 [Candidatus Colwellbacteria bacterium]|nr:hypothetical protein [Candidatus Colwellbacteria bacterium]
MPDVKVFLGRKATERDWRRLWKELPPVVAEEMSCDYWGPPGPPGFERVWQRLQLDPEANIDLMVFADVDGATATEFGLKSTADVIIEVTAYAYPGRVRNLEERLTNIATAAKKVLGENLRASITFVPIKEGNWFAI